MLVKNPAFTGAVIVTLALGIGLNAAVFSAVHGLLLRPLPGVENPDRIVQVYRSWPGIEYGSNSIPHFRDLRDRSEEVGTVDGMASWAFVNLSLSSEGENEIAWGEMVSANFFDVLGVNPVLGRTFTLDESVERAGVGGSPVVVLSYGAWQGRFGGDRNVVGRTVTINGSPFEVVGVAPEGFTGPMPVASPVLWAPLAMEPTLMAGSGSNMEERGSNFMNIVARIPADASVDRVRQGLDRVVDGLRETYPDQYERSGVVVVPQSEAGIHPMIADSQVAMSSVILAVVALLLLVACVNVANLFLARAEDRRREIGIRLSVGAGRMRIVRQLLTESLLFALAAGIVGLGLAALAIRIMNGIQPPTDLPLGFDFELSMPVLAFTLGAALVTGLVFGLAPAIQASKPETVGALKGDAAAPGGSGTRISRGLVVVQTALSVVLLLSAGIFLRNLQAASEMDVGFQADHLRLARVAPGLQGSDRPRAEALYRDVKDRIEVAPGVTAAAWAEIVPLGLASQQTSVAVGGYEPGPDEQMSIGYNRVGPDYFEAMGIDLRGRGFTEADDSTAQPVLVVNQTMAERFWPGEDALGRTVETRGEDRLIVGIAENGKYFRLGEEPTAQMYLPMAQDFPMWASIQIRTTDDPTTVVPRLRQAVRELDPTLPLADVRTMESHLGIAMLPSRVAGSALGIFGILGLILAAVGIYGVIAYGVSRETREIGIRVALGAGRSRVLAMVLKRGGILVVIGVAIGLVAAFGVAGLVRDLLYTGRAVDPVVFVSVPLVLTAVALLATWIPARRAAGADPMNALRGE